ncbi:MAG: NAD(P)/FAD-dependent oxidoreductase [Ilumatobacter sp.]|nr:MAG: NAD(P)/FAD-dependent oxidoreductase [Ilumatobacter sp.]
MTAAGPDHGSDGDRVGAQADEVDVVVVGGGPAGMAAAHTLGRAGHRVTVVERQRHPRMKTCGDALSPRAVAELAGLGIGRHDLDAFHRIDTVRLVAGHRSLDCPWPAHPDLPAHGYVARRDVLDALLAERLAVPGVELLEGYEATTPLLERGFVRGAGVSGPGDHDAEVRGRYLLVADGANSRFGRALGTYRRRSWPYATAIRSYWATPRHSEPLIECALDLTGRDGSALTGYGWVFPLGDGTANIGVGVLSTSHEFRSVNTSELLQRFVNDLAERWELDPEAPLAPPVSGRIPVGGSVGPSAGPSHLVVGDAGGFANPLTGAGIEYALATGRLAGEILSDALTSHDPTALQRYPTELAAAFGSPFKIGRVLGRVAGRPTVMRQTARLLTRRRRIGEGALRIGLDALRTDDAGGAETLARLARTASRFAPDT